MSSIRPLATIAVLAALGVFLAFKINEGPPVALNDEWSAAESADAAIETPDWDGSPGQAPEAVEPAAFGGQEPSSSPTARSAPAWAEAAEPAEKSQPAFPSLPDLPAPSSDPAFGDPAAIEVRPDLADTRAGEQPNESPSPGATAPAFPTTTDQPLTMPDSVPQASYPDSSAPAISGSVPSLRAATPSGGAGESASTNPNGPPGFDVAWEAIEAALARDELPRAHLMLSQWRAQPGLTAEQERRVEALLGQVAGSVVYSTEHRLEPPHIVKPGETLSRIAQQYDVPWQLLAKINGVASSDALTPGQTLKIVRGPFNAEVDVQRGELVVLLDGRYAGKFPVRVEGAAPGDGVWRVGQKRLDEVRRPLVGAVVPTAAAAVREPKVVLENSTGGRVELSASTMPTTGGAGRLSVASNDLADLYDILSVGSSVTIRR